MDQSLASTKNELIEKLGVLIESKEQMASVAARILAYLILNGKKGATFEQLVTDLCASKSTISTHLTHLHSAKRINYHTKLGDRKKYYVISPDSIIQSIDEMIEGWNHQKRIHIEIMAYKDACNCNRNNDGVSDFDLEFHKDYLVFIEEASTAILKLKEKLNARIKS